MFFNFKSKPKLIDLIPHGYVDIHSHLLFGLDDGTKTADDTLAYLKQLQNWGWSKVITTPHIMEGVYPNTPEKINHRLQEVQALVKQYELHINIEAGAEYMMDHFFYEHFKSHKLQTLKGNHILVEMSYLNPPVQLFDMLYDLQVEGYELVLAHPERYLYYFKNFNAFDKIKNAGAQFQLNLLSLVGYYGPESQKTAERLLQAGMIDFVGSDIHHQQHLNSFEKKISLKETFALEAAFERNKFFAG